MDVLDTKALGVEIVVVVAVDVVKAELALAESSTVVMRGASASDDDAVDSFIIITVNQLMSE